MRARKLVLGPALAGLVLTILTVLSGAGTFTRGGDAALAAATAGPVNTGRPTIVGSAKVGELLAATNGTWTGSGTITYAYQWQQCDSRGMSCADIKGATNNSYIPQASDVGKTVGIRVTASDSAGSATVYSDLAGPIAPSGDAPAYTTQPTITGTAREGQTLTVSNGVWKGATPMTYTYQWQRCDQNGANCDLIQGAAKQSYTLAAADVGHTVLAAVTAKNSLGSQVGFTTRTDVVVSKSAPTTTTPTTTTPATTAPPGATIAITSVSLPDRLIISGVAFSPSVLPAGSAQFSGRFRVTDSNKHPVSGALVYAVALPYNRIDGAPEVTTDTNGYATIPFVPLHNLGHGAHIVFFLRARKPGGDILGGVSTRRLAQVVVK